tara:strand:+ start:1331 stop:2053 length:723 start_codon:yes stop_codon:yes gene_type:complete
MIQWTANSATYNYAYLSLNDNRISVDSTNRQIRYLFKFINDMDGSVQYTYPSSIDACDRFVSLRFTWIVGKGLDMYGAEIELIPSGHWKYEVYEVAWEDVDALVTEGTAPATELDVLTPADTDKGIVQGIVSKGILNLTEEVGEEQVQYVQKAKSVQTLTVTYAGTGYTTAPTITITGDNITQATATCTILAGALSTVTITNAGSGYTTNPTVTVTGGGATEHASIVANIEQTNYIFYGQ